MEQYFKELENRLRPIFEKLKQELAGIRSGRPTPQLVEHIPVEYAEQTLAVRELGSIGIKPPREIDITVWDQGAVNAVIAAIQKAKNGLSVSNEGTVVRCFLPPLSEERRTELARLVSKTAEAVRISIRAARDEANKKIKTAEGTKELTKDQVFKTRERVQKIVDDANLQIETLVRAKLEELRD